MANVQWIPETTAAQKLGLQPRTLRRLCKDGKLAINLTHINGRRYQYNETDIIKQLNKNAQYPVRA